MATATKPMAYLRKHPKITELLKKGTGYITDLGGRHEVRLDWKLNEVSQRDKVFKLTVDGKEVYIDLEELTFYTRSMFN
jgi:hypothetical protein